jgi:hypothetical protein
MESEIILARREVGEQSVVLGGNRHVASEPRPSLSDTPNGVCDLRRRTIFSEDSGLISSMKMNFKLVHFEPLRG